MCSVFGFVAKKGNLVSLDKLAQIIVANVARGPHALGYSWITKEGRLRCWKSPGNPTQMLGTLKMLKGATMVIGHLRFATHGDPMDNITNHPHPCDGGWFVHNGVIGSYESLVSRYRLHPVSACDSEVLGLLAEQSEEQTAMARMIAAVEHTGHSNLTVLGLWNRKRQLVAIRRGNPLHIVEADDGYYLASMARGLPGKDSEVKAVKDYSAIRFTQRGISVDIEYDHVKRPEVPARAPVTIPRTTVAAESFDEEWWKSKPGSHVSKPAAASAGEVDTKTYRGG